jgi:hypothetical protein
MMMNKILVIALGILPVFAQAQSFKYKNTESGFKNYQGLATLTGKFSRNLDPEYLDYMGDDICFEHEMYGFALATLMQQKRLLSYQTILKKVIANMKDRQRFKLKTIIYL